MTLPAYLRVELDRATDLAEFTVSREDGRPWVLFGSAVLLLHGLRARIGDVDVFVAPMVWAVLSQLGWTREQPAPEDPPFLRAWFGGHEVHAFFSWTLKDPEVDARQCRRAAEQVEGWWCTPLELVRLHKVMSLPKLNGDPRAEKHRLDVGLIDVHQAALAFEGR